MLKIVFGHHCCLLHYIGDGQMLNLKGMIRVNDNNEGQLNDTN